MSLITLLLLAIIVPPMVAGRHQRTSYRLQEQNDDYYHRRCEEQNPTDAAVAASAADKHTCFVLCSYTDNSTFQISKDDCDDCLTALFNKKGKCRQDDSFCDTDYVCDNKNKAN